MNTTLKTLPNSQVIIKTHVTPRLMLEPKIVSPLQSMSMKMNNQVEGGKFSLGLSIHNRGEKALLGRYQKWADPEYRQSYMEASVEQGIAWQIRANRLKRNMTQAALAELLGTVQSGVSRLEDPEYGGHSIETLVKIAHVFDCALSIKLISYKQLAEDSIDLSPKTMACTSFTEDIQYLQGAPHVPQINS